MDSQTILVSIITSGIFTSAIGFMLKRSFERALDVRFERLKEENKAQIQEQARRQAQLYDKQTEIVKKVLSLVYRARNTSRDLIAEIQDASIAQRLKSYKDKFLLLSKYKVELEGLRFDNRALIPEYLFKTMHDLNNVLGRTHLILEDIGHKRRNKKQISDTIQRLQKHYNHLDFLYHQIVIQGQNLIGVEKDVGA